MQVLSPVVAGAVAARALARRRSSLRGARIAVLDNSKPNADVLLGRVAELLVARAGAASVRTWRKPGSSRAATVLDEIAGAADVVLTGSAD
ncbi:MAG TPA: hypothetical protein VFX28_25440 [Methylomirabilota bacterium]|nr:hypothetical protein [Methylomirabilota bacterium]